MLVRVLSIFRGKAILVEMPLTYTVLSQVVGDDFALFEAAGFIFVYNPEFYLHKNNRVTLVYKKMAFVGRVIVFQIDWKGNVKPFWMPVWKGRSSKFRVFDGKNYDYYIQNNNYSFDYSGLNTVSPLDFEIGVSWHEIDGGGYEAFYDYDDDELFD